VPDVSVLVLSGEDSAEAVGDLEISNSAGSTEFIVDTKLNHFSDVVVSVAGEFAVITADYEKEQSVGQSFPVTAQIDVTKSNKSFFSYLWINLLSFESSVTGTVIQLANMNSLLKDLLLVNGSDNDKHRSLYNVDVTPSAPGVTPVFWREYDQRKYPGDERMPRAVILF